MPNLSTAELTDLAARALRRAGASHSMARAAAEALVRADAEGLPTHGVSRVALYAEHLRAGRAKGDAVARVKHEKGAACLVDAGFGLAFEAAALAVREAIRRAQEFGVGLAGVTDSHHIGAVALALEPVAQAGMAGLAMTNSPAAMNAWGGRTPLLGTNPVAAIFPRRGAPPLVIDLSLTEVTRGKIMLAAKEGKPIPEGWALDRDGNPTTDARAALTGSLFPIGGVKGTMLALVVEVLCCVLTGAAFSFEADSYFEPGNAPRIGQLFLAIDPAALAGRDAYFDRLEVLVAALLADDGVRLPGERRARSAAASSASGIDISEALHRQLLELAG